MFKMTKITVACHVPVISFITTKIGSDEPDSEVELILILHSERHCLSIIIQDEV